MYARRFFDVPLERPGLLHEMRDVRAQLQRDLRDPEIFMASDLRREFRTAVDELTTCIQYVTTELLRIARERRIRANEQQLAFSMGSHPRLGADSPFRAMPRDVMRELANQLL